MTDVKEWLAIIWRPLAAFAAVLCVVGAVATSGSRFWWLLLIVALVVVTTWFGTVSQRQRRKSDFAVSRARLIVGGGILAAVALGWLIVPRAIPHPALWLNAALSFVAIGLALLAVGGLIAELRMIEQRQRYGRWLLVVAVLLLGIGLLVGWSSWTKLLLGLGILASILGCEMVSEQWMRRARDERADTVPPPFRSWRGMLLAGATALGLTAVALIALGTAPVTALVVVAVVLVLVSLATARSDNLLITMVVAVALLWASAPRAEGVAPAARQASGRPYFVVLGDSYISGEGAAVYQKGTNTKRHNDDRTNECRRANTAWPILLAASHAKGVPDRTFFLACSGAVARQLETDPYATSPKGRKAAELVLYRRDKSKFAGGAAAPNFALVSIGGNDANFGKIGQTCVGPGNCTEFRQQFLDSLKDLPTKLDRAYHDINETFGRSVPVVVVPYPDPIAEGEVACRGVYLRGDERAFVRDYVSELNRTIRDTAVRWGFHYMDTMYGALADGGSRLCEAGGSAGLNFISWHPQGGSIGDALLPTNWTHNSLHPNEEGHQRMRDAAERWFEDNVDTLKAPGAHPEIAVGEPAPSRAIVPSKWLPDQALALGRRVSIPIALAAFGAWLVLIVQLRGADRRRWSLAGKVKEIGSWIIAEPPERGPAVPEDVAPQKAAPKKAAPKKAAAKKAAAKKVAPKAR